MIGWPVLTWVYLSGDVKVLCRRLVSGPRSMCGAIILVSVRVRALSMCMRARSCTVDRFFNLATVVKIPLSFSSRILADASKLHVA